MVAGLVVGEVTVDVVPGWALVVVPWPFVLVPLVVVPLVVGWELLQAPVASARRITAVVAAGRLRHARQCSLSMATCPSSHPRLCWMPRTDWGFGGKRTRPGRGTNPR